MGRDYIMTGYYSEIYFPGKGVRYIAIADNFDSLKNDNDIWMAFFLSVGVRFLVAPVQPFPPGELTSWT